MPHPFSKLQVILLLFTFLFDLSTLKQCTCFIIYLDTLIPRTMMLITIETLKKGIVTDKESLYRTLITSC